MRTPFADYETVWSEVTEFCSPGQNALFAPHQGARTLELLTLKGRDSSMPRAEQASRSALGARITTYSEQLKNFSNQKYYRLRSIRIPSESPEHSSPTSPISGKAPPVFGSLAGGGSGAAAVGAGAAAAEVGTRAGAGASISKAPCMGGVGGGGGADPVTFRCSATTVSGTAVNTVADTFIPFLSSKAVNACPSIVNFWSLGILYCLLVLSGRVKITVLGGLTCHTLPEMVLTVVTVRGVAVVTIVLCSFMPGLRS